jgi:predicted nucleic acid-binding protein
MILADTSVWVDHFNKTSPGLAARLDRREIAIHPFIIGELACGMLPRRQEVLTLLHSLPAVDIANDADVLALIEARRLMGQGLSYTDMHLAASCLLSGAELWTGDRALAKMAKKLGVAFAVEGAA